MHLPNLHTAPMRHLIQFRTFHKKRCFLLQIESLCDVLKVLHSTQYTRRREVLDHQLKITFQLSDFVRKALFICRKRQPHLPCESINFIIFLFIVCRKCQNNLPKPKTS